MGDNVNTGGAAPAAPKYPASLPTTMEETPAGSPVLPGLLDEPVLPRVRVQPVLPGLPDDISIWEILARLPPKDVPQCRDVCPKWRRVTSTENFLIANHHKQPTLPVLEEFSTSNEGRIWNLFQLDLSAGLSSADQQLKPVVQCSDSGYRLVASCHGLIAVSSHDYQFLVANPATGECFYAPIRMYASLLGFYFHFPSLEYCLLLNKVHMINNERHHEVRVLTVGSGQMSRYIDCPFSARLSMHLVNVDVLGTIYWCNGEIIVEFDKISECFRQIEPPITPLPAGDCDIFKLGDDKLGLFTVDKKAMFVEVWSMEDQAKVSWVHRHTVVLPIDEFQGLCHQVTVVSYNGAISLLAVTGQNMDSLLQLDTSGKLVARINRERLLPTGVLLKACLFPFSFFNDPDGAQAAAAAVPAAGGAVVTEENESAPATGGDVEKYESNEESDDDMFFGLFD